MIHLIVTLVLISFAVRLILRLVFRPFRRSYYGYNPYHYGCRRHHRLLGGVLPILGLVALDRLFRRW